VFQLHVLSLQIFYVLFVTAVSVRHVLDVFSGLVQYLRPGHLDKSNAARLLRVSSREMFCLKTNTAELPNVAKEDNYRL